jgi:hypothetical protein
MKILEKDIKDLTEKESSTFELPTPYETDENIAKIEAFLVNAPSLNDHVNYNRYLSHMYGRLRCKAIYDMTKEEIFKSDHNKNRIEALSNLQTILTNLGGLIT